MDVNGDTFVFPDGWNVTEAGTRLDFTHFNGGSWGDINAKKSTVFLADGDVTVSCPANGFFYMTPAFVHVGMKYINTANGSLIYDGSADQYSTAMINCSVECPTPNGSAGVYTGRGRSFFNQCYFKNISRTFRDYGLCIENCVFDTCSMYNGGSGWSIENCLFINSHAGTYGGSTNQSHMNRCTFIGGGSNYFSIGYCVPNAGYTCITNCLFKDALWGLHRSTSADGGYCSAFNNYYYNVTNPSNFAGCLIYEDPIELTEDPLPTPGVYVPVTTEMGDIIGFDPSRFTINPYIGPFPSAGGSAIPPSFLQIRV